jgi:carboxymethylenebutenolidase
MASRDVSDRWIDVPGGGTRFAYLVRPAFDRPRGGILVLHEAFGLNADIQLLCRRLAEHGYAALAPDLYWRGPEHLAGYQERDKAITMLKSLPDAQVLADAAHALDLLHHDLDDLPLGVVGLRIGGRYALLVTAREWRRIRAGISYYGAGIAGGTISPLWTINALEEARGLSRPLLLFFVDDDPTVPPDEVASIDAGLRASGATYQIVHYPGVRPGFVFPGRDTYAAREADDAWHRTLTFFDAELLDRRAPRT